MLEIPLNFNKLHATQLKNMCFFQNLLNILRVLIETFLCCILWIHVFKEYFKQTLTLTWSNTNVDHMCSFNREKKYGHTENGKNF